MIKISSKGTWDSTFGFLNKSKTFNMQEQLTIAGEKGLAALRAATPKRTGVAANAWRFRIKKINNVPSVEWYNTDIENGYNVALLIQYGHGTKSGTYVQGIDYINPALRPVFQEVADNLWREVNA